jgi:hypothetical protein
MTASPVTGVNALSDHQTHESAGSRELSPEELAMVSGGTALQAEVVVTPPQQQPNIFISID